MFIKDKRLMSKRVIPHKNCVQPVGFVYLTAILSASQRAQCQGHNSQRQHTYIVCRAAAEKVEWV